MPEMAVAQGAAYYGLVRRGLATRIKGGTPRAFYIGVDRPVRRGACPRPSRRRREPARMAVCLAPPGPRGRRARAARARLPARDEPAGQLPAVLVEHARGSARRARADRRRQGRDDRRRQRSARAAADRHRAARARPQRGHRAARGPHHRARRARDRVRRHRAGETWKLAFDMRSGGAAQTAPTATEDAAPHPKTDEAKAKIQAAFTTGAGLQTLTRDLETLLEARRDEWSMMTTRALFDALVEVAADRKKTADHEQRWLNLAGFLLRPGTGAPLDTWRVARDVGRVQRGPRVSQERARQARVVDRVAADRRRPREGPAGADLRPARAAAAAEHEAGEEARRGQAEQAGARRDVARGRVARAAARSRSR